MTTRIVILESPYAGARWDVPPDHPDALNLRYLRACMADALSRGEIPVASHALYTQPGVLRDEVPEERATGILAGFDMAADLWRLGAPRIFCINLGWTGGMKAGREHAMKILQRIEIRRLKGWVA